MGNVLHLDTGFSANKGILDGKEFKFPSCVGIFTDSTIKLDSQDSFLSFEGKNYMVGRNALDLENKKYARSIEFIIEYSPLFVIQALMENNADDDSVTDLSVGLPLFYYKNHKEDLIKRLSAFTINGKNYTFNVVVHAQTIGAFTNYILKQKPDHSERGYVIDIGFNTVIALRYADLCAKSIGSKQYDRAGISKALTNLQNYIQSNHGITLNSIEINDVFLKRELRAGYGSKIDLKDVIEKIIEDYIDSLLKTIEDEFDDYLKNADRLIIVGGGSYYIGDLIPNKYRNFLFIPNEAEFENVRGYEQLYLNIKKETDNV